MFYDPRENLRPAPLTHNPLNALVAPRPVGWISTINKKGEVNLAPYSYFNALSADPPMVMFAPNSKDAPGEEGELEVAKDSYRNILQVPEFVVNIVSWDVREQMIKTSAALDYGVSEFAEAKLTAQGSVSVKPPRVAEAKAHLECKVFQVGDLPEGQDGRKSYFVIGEVVGIHIKDEVIENGKVIEEKIQQVSRLGYFNYNKVANTFEMKRP